MALYEDTSQPDVLTRLQPLPLFNARPEVTFPSAWGEVAWERCVYNAGAIRIDGVTYVLYRSLGEDGFSRLGLWVTYRSPKPILVPEEECELKGWVDDVVFTCGVAPVDKDSHDLLSLDDEIIVYYGSADEVMCAARGRIKDIVGAS